jgi:hypothetical protein
MYLGIESQHSTSFEHFFWKEKVKVQAVGKTPPIIQVHRRDGIGVSKEHERKNRSSNLRSHWLSSVKWLFMSLRFSFFI